MKLFHHIGHLLLPLSNLRVTVSDAVTPALRHSYWHFGVFFSNELKRFFSAGVGKGLERKKIQIGTTAVTSFLLIGWLRNARATSTETSFQVSLKEKYNLTIAINFEYVLSS